MAPTVEDAIATLDAVCRRRGTPRAAAPSAHGLSRTTSLYDDAPTVFALLRRFPQLVPRYERLLYEPADPAPRVTPNATLSAHDTER